MKHTILLLLLVSVSALVHAEPKQAFVTSSHKAFVHASVNPYVPGSSGEQQQGDDHHENHLWQGVM